jgi:hypothetical protein
MSAPPLQALQQVVPVIMLLEVLQKS